LIDFHLHFRGKYVDKREGKQCGRQKNIAFKKMKKMLEKIATKSQQIFADYFSKLVLINSRTADLSSIVLLPGHSTAQDSNTTPSIRAFFFPV